MCNCKRIAVVVLLLSIGAWAQIINGGAALLVASQDLTAQSANLTGTTVYSVPAGLGGTYFVYGYAVVTQAATSSSTLPAVTVKWTDKDTGTIPAVNAQITFNGLTSNVVGTSSGNSVGWANSTTLQVAAGSNIQIITTGYASVGATPMLFAIHIKVLYLGQ